MQLLEFVVVPLLLVATIGPVLRQDLRRLARVWGVGLPVAVLVGLSGAQFTQLAIGATDAAVPGHRRQPGATLGGSLRGLSTAMVMPGAPQLVAAVIACLLIVGVGAAVAGAGGPGRGHLRGGVLHAPGPGLLRVAGHHDGRQTHRRVTGRADPLQVRDRGHADARGGCPPRRSFGGQRRDRCGHSARSPASPRSACCG